MKQGNGQRIRRNIAIASAWGAGVHWKDGEGEDRRSSEVAEGTLLQGKGTTKAHGQEDAEMWKQHGAQGTGIE